MGWARRHLLFMGRKVQLHLWKKQKPNTGRDCCWFFWSRRRKDSTNKKQIAAAADQISAIQQQYHNYTVIHYTPPLGTPKGKMKLRSNTYHHQCMNWMATVQWNEQETIKAMGAKRDSIIKLRVSRMKEDINSPFNSTYFSFTSHQTVMQRHYQVSVWEEGAQQKFL